MEEQSENVKDIIETRICPECKALLTANYTATAVTYACSLFLCIGLACWVPCVVDACQRVELQCEKCDKKVAEMDPHCLCL